MFRIKVCGVTRVEDALAVAESGADAIGLNFYERSPRCVSLEQARRLASAVEGRLLRVGVFVNATSDRINEVCETTPLDAIQLHGDEPASLLAELARSAPVVRAARMGAEGLAPAAKQLQAAAEIGCPFGAILIDAAGQSGQYGGTGQTADWGRLQAERADLGATPLILAGGLTPANVADAIAATLPHGVDTASGVESSPGVKSPRLVAEFAAAAKEAFDRLSGIR